jgi:hypothetical protein
MIDSQKRTMFLFRWESKLFITPSRMILHTGIALSVTLVVIAVVLALLQYREKVCSNEEVMNKCLHIFQIEDNRERKVQSQRFHYDAL